MTEQDVFRVLRAAHDLRQWVIFPQIRDSTGWSGAGRTADAIAMNTWPSRGLEVHGFEIKTYRGDWLRELKKPQKAEAIFRFCDRWWIVVPDHEGRAIDVGGRTLKMDPIVKPEELPPTWGLLYVSEKGSRVGVPAPKLEPKPLSRTFIASVLRAAMQDTPEHQFEQARLAGRQEGYDEGYKAGIRTAQERGRDWRDESRRLDYIEQELAKALKNVRSQRADLDRKLAALTEEAAS